MTDPLSGHDRATRPPRVLITGAGGYLGRQLVAALAAGGVPGAEVLATDLHEPSPAARVAGIGYACADVRVDSIEAVFTRFRPDVVVHLASIVTPGPRSTAAEAHAVDVDGTRHVLQACRAGGARRIVVSSSGAAYGYHADNPPLLTEDCALRGHPSFAYAQHKRRVEEMLAQWRVEQPALQQVVLRIGTILGATVHNQITALFERRRPLALRGAASPFNFVWDQDVVAVLLRAIDGGPAGIYNVAGDGVLTMREIAARLGKRCLVLPPGLLRAALAVLHPLGLTRYGPEQLDFLRYRPVLDNTRLKTVLGVVPRLDSAQVFDLWARTHGHAA